MTPAGEDPRPLAPAGLPDAARAEAQAAAERLLHRPGTVRPLTPEASARRYWRPTHPGARGWLVVTAPDPAPRAATALLAERGLRVPRLGAEIPGAYLVEDLGDRHLADAPRPSRYRAVLAAWRRMNAGGIPDALPHGREALDAALFRNELRLFRSAWVQGVLGRACGAAAADDLDARLDALADDAAAGPRALQHRDLHGRNLLLPDDGEPAWIDHQDLRPGPLFYDLASLRTDAYVELPDAVAALLGEEVAALGAAHGLDRARAQERFRTVALQRVLKALGTFGRLLATGRTDYAAAGRRARRHALALAGTRPDTAPLADLLA